MLAEPASPKLIGSKLTFDRARSAATAPFHPQFNVFQLCCLSSCPESLFIRKPRCLSVNSDRHNDPWRKFTFKEARDKLDKLKSAKAVLSVPAWVTRAYRNAMTDTTTNPNVADTLPLTYWEYKIPRGPHWIDKMRAEANEPGPEKVCLLFDPGAHALVLCLAAAVRQCAGARMSCHV